MTTPTDVVNLIRQWALSAGGDQLRQLGYATLQAIQNTSPANDPDYSIEASRFAEILACMRSDGWTKEALVLEVHYLSESLTEPERIARIRRKGLQVGRTAYYIYLNTAHAYASAALTFGHRSQPITGDVQ